LIWYCDQIVTQHLDQNSKTLCYDKVIHKINLSSPFLWTCFHALIPSFSGIHQVKKFLLNLNMKSWKSAFNAQGLRVIIIIVHVRVLEVLRKKERKDENWFTTKIGGKMKVWVPLIWLWKNFILNYAMDGLLCWNWLFSPLIARLYG
jgi:hypothetical protein